MSNAVPTPQFVTAEASADGGMPQTVTKIAPLDSYIAQYRDGEGKTQVRICFKVPGSDAVFVLNEMIGGRKLATTATGWFKDQFNEQLSQMEPVGEEGEVGEEGVRSF